jgi:hypothetical protein
VESNEIRSCETADDADDDESDDFLRIERKLDAKIGAKKRSQRVFVLPKNGENAEDEGGHDGAEKGAPVITNGEICRSDFDREKHAADRRAKATAHADSASSTEAENKPTEAKLKIFLPKKFRHTRVLDSFSQDEILNFAKQDRNNGSHVNKGTFFSDWHSRAQSHHESEQFCNEDVPSNEFFVQARASQDRLHFRNATAGRFWGDRL